MSRYLPVSLAAPANLDGVLKELEKARSNKLEMMHALGFVMHYRTACASPGPSLRKPALLQEVSRHGCARYEPIPHCALPLPHTLMRGRTRPSLVVDRQHRRREDW
jgi:hypothetical protein